MMNEKKIISGKKIANEIFDEIKTKVAFLQHLPQLTIIQVGDNKASSSYVRNKLVTASRIGILANLQKFPEGANEKEIIDCIETLNFNKIPTIVQLPLPKHLNTFKIINTINHKLDVDGLTTINQGLLLCNTPHFAPCTPLGIITLLKRYHIELSGRNVVIIGRSNLVGKPLFHMLVNENATVTLCHSKTVNLPSITSKADILVSAIGKPLFITKDFVREGGVVVDVGISHIDGQIVGDVDYDNVIDKVGMITPVPGGIGPMTVAMLMQNTLDCSS